MTECDHVWKAVPGAQYYENCHRGHIRSLPRTRGGRSWPGKDPMSLREDGDGYLVFNYTDDAGVRQTNVSVARITLLTWDPEGYRPGMQACHGPGGQKDNRYPENIRWDTPEANRAEALAVRLENNPPKPPKPPLLCVNYERCGRPAGKGGRRCHPCVEEVGRQGAALLADGTDLEKAAEMLDYASAVGLWRLAAKYGGARVVIEAEMNAALRAASHAESRPRRSLRVLFRREASGRKQ